MPNREHTNTCEATLSALENIRDMDEAALSEYPEMVRKYHSALAGWTREIGVDDVEKPGFVLLLGMAREWAALYVQDDMSECDCDAKYIHVIARRWHRSHYTTAPARVIARIAADSYVVEFLTPGPGEPRQGAFRYAMAVALDDITYVDAMEITP